MKIHSNAKLTPQGRQLLIDRVSGGMSVALACKSMGVSTTTGYKWLRRARDGEPLTDHSSRPHTMPRKTSSKVEEEVIKARIEKHLSPLNLERETGVPARTCARIVKRNECPKLADIDRVTGELIQRGPVTNERYEKDEPGEMIHMDVKKLQGSLMVEDGVRRGCAIARAGVLQKVACMLLSTTTVALLMSNNCLMRKKRR